MIVPLFVASFRRSFPDLVGGRLVVAVSGGSDSVALLGLLAATRGELAADIVAAHVHHHLRGAEADDDLEFCRQLSGALGVPFAVRHLVPEHPRGMSPEGWWRSERYRLLEEVRCAESCDAIATAHTKDDQAETVLLKMLRGAGPRGVAGVRRRAGWIVRPVLEYRRNELRDWLVASGQSWREDTTNVTASRPRSVVRREVLPFLVGHSPRLEEHLAAFAESLADDEDVLARVLRERGNWPQVGRPAPLHDIRLLPRALQRRWLLELASRLPLSEPPSRRQLEQFLLLLAEGTPSAVDLGRRWVIRRRGEKLVLSPPPCLPFAPIFIDVPSSLTLPGGFFGRIGMSRPGTSRYRAVLSRRCETSRLSWRSLRHGERLPEAGGRAVAALLARAGVPAEWRRGWPVVEADGRMIWAPGVGVAAGWEGESGGIVAELEEPCQRHER
jgi:tRNA(Ile)-lysidine synthase